MTTTDEKKYSERELILAKREAWVECDREFVGENSSWLAESQRMAAKRYPLPKVKRLRVVTDPYSRGVEWRVSKDGNIERRTHLQYDSYDGDRAWKEDLGSFMAAPLRVAVWADLFANPFEEVDADD